MHEGVMSEEWRYNEWRMKSKSKEWRVKSEEFLALQASKGRAATASGSIESSAVANSSFFILHSSLPLLYFAKIICPKKRKGNCIIMQEQKGHFLYHFCQFLSKFHKKSPVFDKNFRDFACRFRKKSYLCSDKSHHTSRPQGQCTRVGLRFLWR